MRPLPLALPSRSSPVRPQRRARPLPSPARPLPSPAHPQQPSRSGSPCTGCAPPPVLADAGAAAVPAPAAPPPVLANAAAAAVLAEAALPPVLAAAAAAAVLAEAALPPVLARDALPLHRCRLIAAAAAFSSAAAFSAGFAAAFAAAFAALSKTPPPPSPSSPRSSSPLQPPSSSLSPPALPHSPPPSPPPSPPSPPPSPSPLSPPPRLTTPVSPPASSTPRRCLQTICLPAVVPCCFGVSSCERRGFQPALFCGCELSSLLTVKTLLTGMTTDIYPRENCIAPAIVFIVWTFLVNLALYDVFLVQCEARVQMAHPCPFPRPRVGSDLYCQQKGTIFPTASFHQFPLKASIFLETFPLRKRNVLSLCFFLILTPKMRWST